MAKKSDKPMPAVIFGRVYKAEHAVEALLLEGFEKDYTEVRFAEKRCIFDSSASRVPTCIRRIALRYKRLAFEIRVGFDGAPYL
jgi:hypothetical protein